MKPTSANEFTIYPISESGVTIEFGNIIDKALLDRVTAFHQQLVQNPFPGMGQTVPAYATLTVFFDPLTVICQNTLPGNTCRDKVCAYLNQLKSGDNPSPKLPEGEPISIPVCYGGEFGPDLEYLAGYHQLGVEEVISLHSSALYKVYMVGFVPGFTYMGGLNDQLETPRKATPNKVPAGAVGIAGKQTGIYSLEIPGGWQIIGQTPVKPFDAGRNPPALLKAGDRVKFEPVSSVDFEKHSKG